jgi:hypothetical protein
VPGMLSPWLIWMLSVLVGIVLVLIALGP